MAMFKVLKIFFPETYLLLWKTEMYTVSFNHKDHKRLQFRFKMESPRESLHCESFGGIQAHLSERCNTLILTC